MPFPLFIPLLTGGAVGTAYFQARKDRPENQPFATDPKYRTRQAAVANYVDHVRSMAWPEDLTEVLELEATFAPGSDAEDVYLHMLREGPVVLQDMQYDPADIRNWGKVQDWLQQAAEASGATTQALGDARISSVIGQTVTASAEDARAAGVWTGSVVKDVTGAARKGAETAARNPWPTVIGIGLVLFGLKRAKII